jgi:peptidoglycan/xylan/chitin deacetylase (PgdA/CDA1 family)
MDRSRLQSKFAATLGLLGALTLQAAAAECPRADALGTSRVLAVDAAATPRVGQVSFPETLELQDREIVLTFDDGPAPDNDEKILAALAEECVRATFFLIGKQAPKNPEQVRRIAAAGTPSPITAGRITTERDVTGGRPGRHRQGHRRS